MIVPFEKRRVELPQGFWEWFERSVGDLELREAPLTGKPHVNCISRC
jgi:hypothetical protein